MVYIANPFYDVVFKYLMENERIARTILSALIKEEIVSVQMRPHDKANGHPLIITDLCVDFIASIRSAEGHDQPVIIILQKTWAHTKTLRFRRYLPMQYESADNMGRGVSGQYAVPMIMVYLLGHRVGDIEEPVIYVRKQVQDYYGQPVTKGLPNPFVDSLTHDSVIVQIPLLHGQVDTRLDRVLSIFEQTHQGKGNQKVFDFDDTPYADDTDMQYVLARLCSAASNPEVRRGMNIEEEFYSEIDRRDSDILERDMRLAQQKVELDEQKTQLNKR